MAEDVLHGAAVLTPHTLYSNTRSAGWQRTFYMVPLYYLLTDPHGLLAETRKGVLQTI